MIEELTAYMLLVVSAKIMISHSMVFIPGARRVILVCICELVVRFIV